ncbi:MAG: hypothetical protein D6791_15835 [Chloroflexi bacterium]|nr:MAG: hypothetical protein D6791_15835 [Chloroflexota bacterium]
MSVLSRSIVAPAASAALVELAASYNLFPNPTSELTLGFSSETGALAWLTASAWGGEPSTIQRLLNCNVALPPVGEAKADEIKIARQQLASLEKSVPRLHSWAERVAGLSWNQANLLQVMEEIEPVVATAVRHAMASAVTAVGAYARLLALVEPIVPKVRGSLALDVVAGVDTPAGRMVDDLLTLERATWQRRYGYQAVSDPYELAGPRLAELESVPWQEICRGPVAWEPARAQQAGERALAEAQAAVGFLQRRRLKAVAEITRAALAAHARIRDALARVLAATRRWSIAAAEDALKDGRLRARSEIFRLELEEVKQILTGEWHSRGKVAPALERRREDSAQAVETSSSCRPLGIAGGAACGEMVLLSRPEEVEGLGEGLVAVIPEAGAVWAPVYLKAAGVVCKHGNWLGLGAELGRYGGITTMVGSPEMSNGEFGQEIRIDPTQDLIEPRK